MKAKRGRPSGPKKVVFKRRVDPEMVEGLDRLINQFSNHDFPKKGIYGEDMPNQTLSGQGPTVELTKKLRAEGVIKASEALDPNPLRYGPTTVEGCFSDYAKLVKEAKAYHDAPPTPIPANPSPSDEDRAAMGVVDARTPPDFKNDPNYHGFKPSEWTYVKDNKDGFLEDLQKALNKANQDQAALLNDVEDLTNEVEKLKEDLEQARSATPDSISSYWKSRCQKAEAFAKENS